MVTLLVFICLLLAVFIPFFVKAKERSTQRTTMREMMIWSQAMGDYIQDHAKAPTNPYGKLHYRKKIVEELSPYLTSVLIVDRWANLFWVWTGPENRQYGIYTDDEKDFIIASYGRQGEMEGWVFDSLNKENGAYPVQKWDDFKNDIVLFNHEFVRYPKFK